MFIIAICHVQVMLMFFGLRHSNTVNNDQILLTLEVLAAALLLFCDDVIFLAMDTDFIRDYSSEEFLINRKTGCWSKV